MLRPLYFNENPYFILINELFTLIFVTNSP